MVYRCPIFKVEERIVSFPGNIKQKHWVVVRQPNVTTVALTNDKKIILIEEIRGKNNIRSLELPGGKLDSYTPNIKDAKNKAIEELEEEAGYKARSVKLLEVYEDAINWRERKYYHFAAWDLEKTTQKLEKGENIKVKLVSLAQVKKILKGHEMTFKDESISIQKGIRFFKAEGIID